MTKSQLNIAGQACQPFQNFNTTSGTYVVKLNHYPPCFYTSHCWGQAYSQNQGAHFIRVTHGWVQAYSQNQGAQQKPSNFCKFR